MYGAEKAGGSTNDAGHGTGWLNKARMSADRGQIDTDDVVGDANQREDRDMEGGRGREW